MGLCPLPSTPQRPTMMGHRRALRRRGAGRRLAAKAPTRKHPRSLQKEFNVVLRCCALSFFTFFFRIPIKEVPSRYFRSCHHHQAGRRKPVVLTNQARSVSCNPRLPPPSSHFFLTGAFSCISQGSRKLLAVVIHRWGQNHVFFIIRIQYQPGCSALAPRLVLCWRSRPFGCLTACCPCSAAPRGVGG